MQVPADKTRLLMQAVQTFGVAILHVAHKGAHFGVQIRLFVSATILFVAQVAEVTHWFPVVVYIKYWPARHIKHSCLYFLGTDM